MSEVASRVVYCVAFDAHGILFFLLLLLLRYPPVYIIAALSIMIKYWQHRWGLFRQWMPAKMYGDDLIVQTHRIYNAFAFISFVSAAILNGILLMTYRDDEGNVIGPVLWCVWCAVTLGLLAATTIVVNVSGREEVRLFIKNRFPGLSRFYCFPMDVDDGENELGMEKKKKTWGEVEKKWLVHQEKYQIGELGLRIGELVQAEGSVQGLEASVGQNFHMKVQKRFVMLYKLRLLRGFDSTQRTYRNDDETDSIILGQSADNGSEFCGSCYAPFYYKRLLNFDVKKWEIGDVSDTEVGKFFSRAGGRWEYNSSAPSKSINRAMSGRSRLLQKMLKGGGGGGGTVEMANIRTIAAEHPRVLPAAPGGTQGQSGYPVVPASVPRAAFAPVSSTNFQPTPYSQHAATAPVTPAAAVPFPGGGAYPASGEYLFFSSILILLYSTL